MKRTILAAIVAIALATPAFAENVFTQASVATFPTDGYYITVLDAKSIAVEDEWFYPVAYSEITIEKGFAVFWVDSDGDGEKGFGEERRFRMLTTETERGIGSLLKNPMDDSGYFIVFHGDGDEEFLFADIYEDKERIATMVLVRE